jgi:hypothetical protein
MVNHSSIILFTIITVLRHSSTALPVPTVRVIAVTAIKFVKIVHTSYHFIALCAVPDLSCVLDHLCVDGCPHLHLLGLLLHLIVVFQFVAYVSTYFLANVYYLGNRGWKDSCRG